MADYKIENLSFTYPNREDKALDNISLTVERGAFITLCGKSGCGKTTLLRLLKPALAPFGDVCGNIYFKNKPLSELDEREQASEIGFVMQSPDNQIVTDKVWHELAFGLESIGIPTSEIRMRVGEMASFFGIEPWFYKNVTELSGGQKQILNLASVMVMQPSVLILDEPTSQLDPIAAQDFLKTLEKINRELGTTVILSEHRLEEAFPISDKVVVMDGGKIVAEGTPQDVGKMLKTSDHDMYAALPTPMRICGAVDNLAEFPVTVREGRCWLEKFADAHPINADLITKADGYIKTNEPAIEIKDAWFRYEKEMPDILQGFNLQINKGEIFAIVGGNGAGKTTALSLISGLNTPYRGKVLINGKSPLEAKNLYNDILSVLPQNPQTLFAKKTVYLDLSELLSETKLTDEEKEEKIKNISALCRIENLLNCHPYDLSGGEQQRAALAKVLLKSPKILLLDEPTKGMDAHFKEEFAQILQQLKVGGVTVVMVSHDIEFCAEYADCCALMFDGNIISSGVPREFFSGKSFYTTSANRMARAILPDAILADDIILACGGKKQEKSKAKNIEIDLPDNGINEKQKTKKLTPKRVILGSVCSFVFLLINILLLADLDIKTIYFDTTILKIVAFIAAVATVACFFPQKELGIELICQPINRRKLTKRTAAAVFLILIAIPLTIYVGRVFLQDRNFYLISVLIIIETMLPFCMIFENRRPQARELIIISVMCAIAVTGRAAFFMFPHFKPVTALVIIAGVCFGGETGFLVGAVTGFVSNFFFGQGPWTPWQMFAFGIVGFLSGILFRKGLLRKTKTSLSVFGFFSAVIVFGGITNVSSVFLMQTNPTVEMIVAACVAGLPFDIVHGGATAFFLWFISAPMIEKLERIKVKFGLVR